MKSAEAQAQRAVAMTSIAPPTNINLLKKWEEEAQDSDLKKLIQGWINHLDIGTSQFAIYDVHQRVHEKVMSGFYKSM
jgi:hypothetical protein